MVAVRRRPVLCQPIMARRGRPILTALLFLGALVAAGLGAAAPSRAAVTEFGSGGTAAGEFTQAQALAFSDESGDVYIADGGNRRVDEFTAEGAFVRAWGWGVLDGREEPQVCSSSCSGGLRAVGKAGGFFTPASVAVDNGAASASRGDVYVLDRGDRAVQKFNATGEFLLMFGKEVNKTTGGDVCTKADLEAGDECGSGASGSGPGELQTPASVAVDSQGRVLVADRNGVQRFSPAGNYEAAPVSGASIKVLVAAGTGDFYAGSGAAGAGLRLYDETGTEIGSPRGAGSSAVARGGTVDSVGDLYVAYQPTLSTVRLLEYAPDGTELASLAPVPTSGAVAGIAWGDARGAVYVLTSERVTIVPPAAPGPLLLPGSQAAREIQPTSVRLEATLNPEGHETTYKFEYGTDTTYGVETQPAGKLPAGFEDSQVDELVTGLIPSTVYHFRLVAEDSQGNELVGPDQSFETQPAVAIGAQWATEVTASAADLHADLDPLGVAATWWLEYGTSESSGLITERQSLKPAFGETEVHVLLSGLRPATEYNYRFVAEDERDGAHYTVRGVERSLTTQPTVAPSALADDRAWEMVTPPTKFGLVLPIGEFGLQQAAAGGGAFTYLTAPLSEEAEGSRGINQVMARRIPGVGWHSRDLALRQNGAIGAAPAYPYRFFTPDLSGAVVEQQLLDETPLSPEATEKTPYVWSPQDCDGLEAGCFRPMVTAANALPGTKFGDEVEFAGATPDLQHAVLESEVALTAEAASGGGLYEWSAGDGQLRLVSVLPGGGSALGPQFGGHAGDGSLTRNAISDDGTRVVFTADHHLYLRDVPDGQTVQLDAIQGGSGSGPAEALFQAASADGSRVFFTDGQRLTANSGGGGRAAADLYVCDIEVDPSTGSVGCLLSDLTPGTPSGEAAAVQGILPGAADDGSSVYFVANGALVPGAVQGDCGMEGAGAQDALCNLYVSRFINGRWQGPRLVAVLSAEDGPDWANTTSSNLDRITSRVSPNGRWLEFMSDRPLTGYDSRDAVSGEPDEEVYLYDADSDRLRCASCSPTNGRPRGTADEAVDAQHLWQGRWLAANVPAWTHSGASNIFHQPRYLSDSGRLFFNSSDALSPRDANETWDVYEFEPVGVGDCGESGPTFSARNGGCVGLISSGQSRFESAFVDATEAGEEVFFWTHARLTAEDDDTQADIYAARLCSAASPCLTPPEGAKACDSAEVCRGWQGGRRGETSAPATAAIRARGNQHPTGACRRPDRRARALRHHIRRLHRRSRALARRGRYERAMRAKRAASRLAGRLRAVEQHSGCHTVGSRRGKKKRPQRMTRRRKGHTRRGHLG